MVDVSLKDIKIWVNDHLLNDVCHSRYTTRILCEDSKIDKRNKISLETLRNVNVKHTFSLQPFNGTV